jgi:predicted DNA-binding transcriptional regulator AlpA
MTTNDQLLTEKQLAERWAVSHRTLRRWRSTARLPPHIRIGHPVVGRVLYRLADVLVFEKQAIRGGGV